MSTPLNYPAPIEQRILEAVIRVEGMGQDIVEIKTSINDMAKAIMKLAVFEERQLTDRVEMGRFARLLELYDQRIGHLEMVQPIQSLTSDWVQKAVWAVTGLALSAVMSLVFLAKSDMQRYLGPVQAPIPVVTGAKP